MTYAEIEQRFRAHSNVDAVEFENSVMAEMDIKFKEEKKILTRVGPIIKSYNYINHSTFKPRLYQRKFAAVLR